MVTSSPKAVLDAESETANPTQKTGSLILAGATALGLTASHAHDILVCSQGSACGVGWIRRPAASSTHTIPNTGLIWQDAL